MPTAPAIDHPGLMPASLLMPKPPRGRRRFPWPKVHRTTRDWLVDITFFLVAVAAGILNFGATEQRATIPELLVFVDVVVGTICCLALWLRRRFPLGVALLTGVVSAVAPNGGVAVMLAMFTVAIHRRATVATGIAILNVVSGTVVLWLRPDSFDLGESTPYWVPVVLSAAITAAFLAWGMFVRARRQLIVSLHERAARAEAEQRLLADQARQAERARIAREMHDVVAHRVSLLALHAGALQMRPDLPAAEVERTAGLIRNTAREALDELRGVIGVLRAPTDREPPEVPDSPQPTLADIPRLVADTQRAGAKVSLTMTVAEPREAPGGLGRDAYRIVQEALTNVAKHAGGLTSTVEVDGRPGEGLQITVRNRIPLIPMSQLPGSGMGLVGLAERVTLSGGTLRHGPTPDGWFEVHADLRWPA